LNQRNTDIRGTDESEAFYCVGCGRLVAKIKPGQMLAVSCPCCAFAPILHTKGSHPLDDGWATPTSLLRVSQRGGTIPPLEYYLGFSKHESEIKTQVTRMLRSLGSVSYTEIPDEELQMLFEVYKKKFYKP